jgi:hypothetical protein
MFWMWLGSAAIEFAAQSAIDRFVRAILKSTPDAVPIVDFILKTGSHTEYVNFAVKNELAFQQRETAVRFIQIGFTFTF